MDDETHARLRLERVEIRAKYPALFDALVALLFRLDPMGVNFEDNDDEYEPEVGTILPRLASCSGVADVQQVIHQEFNFWFGETSRLHGSYAKVAAEVWALWQADRENLHS